MPYPVANPQQVAMDNMRGARGQHGGNQNELRPPNLYYDHGNARQTFHPPAGLQTAAGYIPINPIPSAPPANEGNMAGPSNVGGQPSTQDVRFMGTPGEYQGEEQGNYGPRPDVIIGSMHPEGNTWPPNANVITHELRNPEVVHPALAVVTRAMKDKQPVEEEGSEGEGSSFEDPPPLSDLGKVVRAAKRAAKDLKNQAKNSPEVLIVPDTEESVNCDWGGPGIPVEEFDPDERKKVEKVGSYDLWADLGALKADITFGQLLEISPIARKTLKEGMPVVRRKRKVRARIAAMAQLPGGPSDVRAVEIEAMIVDKVIPNVLVDGGSGINILPFQTMEKLGLSLTGPSPFVINMANQCPEVPLGEITNCRIQTGGEEYVVTFHVIRMQSLKDSYPMLLGRPWLRMARAVVDWGGARPSITYGPEGNRSKVPIGPSIEWLEGGKSSTSSDTEGNDSEHAKERLVGHAQPRRGLASAEIHGLGCMGPSLYQWADDGEYEQWLKDHPNSASDVMTISHVSRVEWERRQATCDWEPCEVLTEE